MKLKNICSLEEKLWQCIKKQRRYFVSKVPSSHSYGFSSSHVWKWELDHKQSWVPKNWCFWTVVLEKTLESPLYCKEIQPINPKANQSWIFIGRTNAEAPIFWPPDVKNWVIGCEFEQAPGVCDGQGSLACWSPWACKELDMTEWLNWTEYIIYLWLLYLLIFV